MVRKPKAPKHPTEPDDDMPVPVDNEPVAEQEDVEPVPEEEVPTAPEQQTAPPEITPFSPGTDSTHKTNVTTAAAAVQIAVKAATTQGAANAAWITYFQTCRTSAIANGFSPSVFNAALQALGSGGT